MRLGIVEDDLLLLQNLQLLLQSEPDMEVVCAYASAESLVKANPWPKLDILLVDIELPGISGIDLIAVAKERQPALICLAYTGLARDQVVFDAIKAGACGYLVKGGGFRELIDALHMVQTGGAPMSPAIARQVLRQFQDMAGAAEGLPADALSHREGEILRALEHGDGYKEIALALAISPHTVNAHTKHIYQKLHARSRQEAIHKARQRGWL